ncbi:MAG TPA: ATP-binding protein [Acidimicrobiales bacterium]|nr:ATP-binding protein [Acidimicrobiales bacterium]
MTPLRLCPTLVARDTEWAVLDSALRAVRNGDGRFIALLGEAGIGKSRLVAEVADAARGQGVPVLLGRAVDSPTPAPFETVARRQREAVRDQCRAAGLSASIEELDADDTPATRWTGDTLPDDREVIARSDDAADDLPGGDRMRSTGDGEHLLYDELPRLRLT